MKILIDLDCVCNNLVEEWILYLNNKYNLNVKYEDITNYDITLAFPTLTKEQIIEPLISQCLVDKYKPIKDSQKYLKRLYEDGHEIRFVTASHYECMKNKCEWMLKYYPFIKYTDIWMIHDKQWIDADVLLDDCIDNLVNGKYLGVCYSQPWNQTYNKKLTINNWKEFYNLIKQLEDNVMERQDA